MRTKSETPMSFEKEETESSNVSIFASVMDKFDKLEIAYQETMESIINQSIPPAAELLAAAAQVIPELTASPGEKTDAGSGFVGYFKDVIDHTLKPTPRRRSPSEVVSPPQTDVISISISKTTLTRERKGSIKGQRHITEDELGTPVNIYLEHRDHLEQDKKARVDLDTKLIKESLYVPNVSPDAVVSPTFKTPESSGPSTPTNTDWDFNIWLGDGMRKDCFYDWYGGMGTHGIMYTSFEGYHGLGIVSR